VALEEYQQGNDVLMAEMVLQRAFSTDVGPIVAEARRRGGGALDPVATFRASGYRAAMADERAAGTYVPPQSL
jgi:L-rhamnose isomerase / sugar isomerase